MRTWIDNELTGTLFFATRKNAVAMYPDCFPVQVQTRFFKGWAALDRGTENGATLHTPDGRAIPRIVWGWGNGLCVMAMRGSQVWTEHDQLWREIMHRVIFGS